MSCLLSQGSVAPLRIIIQTGFRILENQRTHQSSVHFMTSSVSVPKIYAALCLLAAELKSAHVKTDNSSTRNKKMAWRLGISSRLTSHCFRTCIVVGTHAPAKQLFHFATKKKSPTNQFLLLFLAVESRSTQFHTKCTSHTPPSHVPLRLLQSPACCGSERPTNCTTVPLPTQNSDRLTGARPESFSSPFNLFPFLFGCDYSSL